MRRNHMFRALRCDKLVYGALETALRHTLFCDWDRLPALAMIAMSAETVRQRAEAFCQKLDGVKAEVIPGLSVIGGGSTPDQALPTWLIAIETDDVVAAEKSLRTGEPAIVARIEDDRLILDLRTVFAREEEALLTRVRGTCLPTY